MLRCWRALKTAAEKGGVGGVEWGGGEFSQQTRAAVNEGLMKLSRWEVAGDPL